MTSPGHDTPPPDRRRSHGPGLTVERPPEVTASFWVWVALALVSVAAEACTVAAMIDVIRTVGNGDPENPAPVGIMTTVMVVFATVIGAIVMGLFLGLSIAMRAGRPAGRIGLTALGALVMIANVLYVLVAPSDIEGVPFEGGTARTSLALVAVLLAAVALALCYRPRATAFLATPRT